MVLSLAGRGLPQAGPEVTVSECEHSFQKGKRLARSWGALGEL